MKKQVSKNIRPFRFIFVPFLMIILVYYTIYLYSILNDTFDIDIFIINSIISVIFLIIGYLFYKYFDNAKLIEFDDNNLYISGKLEIKIFPLDKIISLNKTRTHINGTFAWKISYLENNKIENKIQFYPRIFNLYFTEFCKTIKKNNPSAQIENFSY